MKTKRLNGIKVKSVELYKGVNGKASLWVQSKHLEQPMVITSQIAQQCKEELFGLYDDEFIDVYAQEHDGKYYQTTKISWEACLRNLELLPNLY